MGLKEQITTARVVDERGREDAIRVMQATYEREKNWMRGEEKLFPSSDLADERISWFVAYKDGQPVGVLRVLYSPPLELYKQYGFKPIGSGIDVEEFVRRNRIAEIGRFAVLPEFRKIIQVAASLMRISSKETIRRGFTHYVTDIFEGEQHSPYEFHRRVMGFQPVASHDVGELNCPNRRITMILDLAAAYERLRASKNWIYRFFMEDWDAELDAALEVTRKRARKDSTPA